VVSVLPNSVITFRTPSRFLGSRSPSLFLLTSGGTVTLCSGRDGSSPFNHWYSNHCGFSESLSSNLISEVFLEVKALSWSLFPIKLALMQSSNEEQSISNWRMITYTQPGPDGTHWVRTNQTTSCVSSVYLVRNIRHDKRHYRQISVARLLTFELVRLARVPTSHTGTSVDVGSRAADDASRYIGGTHKLDFDLQSCTRTITIRLYTIFVDLRDKTFEGFVYSSNSENIQSWPA